MPMTRRFKIQTTSSNIECKRNLSTFCATNFFFSRSIMNCGQQFSQINGIAHDSHDLSPYKGNPNYLPSLSQNYIRVEIRHFRD